LFGREKRLCLAPPSQGQSGPSWLSESDVEETDTEVHVRARVPGFERHEVDVRLHDGVLTIQGDQEPGVSGQCGYRGFCRTLRVPADIDTERAQATYCNGVVELHLPRG
jgi:HSP20 family protein